MQSIDCAVCIKLHTIFWPPTVYGIQAHDNNDSKQKGQFGYFLENLNLNLNHLEK